MNDHPTQIPPSEILGPVVQNCRPIYKVVNALNLGIKIHELDDRHLGLLDYCLLVSVSLLEDGDCITA